MHNFFETFLSLPVGGRAAIFIGIIILMWCVLGQILLNIASVLLLPLKYFFMGIYMLFEIPVSILHKKFGSIFGKIDQGLTTVTEKLCVFTEKLRNKMKNPQTIYRKWFCVAYLIIAAYLLIPIAANLTEKPFTFWQEAYVKKETAFIQWMDDNGWFDK